jgi:hypothetical protein
MGTLPSATRSVMPRRPLPKCPSATFVASLDELLITAARDNSNFPQPHMLRRVYGK